MADYLVRAMIGQGEARVLALKTTDLVEEARQRHDTWHTVTAALGRALTGVAMLGVLMKEEGLVTMRIAGNGPIVGIVVQSDHEGRVRGYALEPQVFVPLKANGKLDVGEAVGREGHLYVTYDYGIKEPYTGVSTLVNGEIGEDLTHYLANSEQIPSAVALGVMVEPSGQVKAAGGLLIQMLPGARAGLAEMIEGKLARMNFISSLIEGGLSPEMILEQLFAEFQLHILEKKELRFQCRCSKDKAASALIGLGKVELEEMLAEDHSVEVRCHFCGDLMEFSDEDLESFIAIAANQAADKPTMS